MNGKKLSITRIADIAAAALVNGAAAHASLPRPEPSASACFDKIKSFAGDWYQKDAKTGKDVLALRYRVVSGGSAVEESIFPGAAHEMVSVYHMDGPNLAMMHYCSLGNQPYMKASASSTPDRVVFDCVSVGNSKSPNDMHMNRAVFVPKDSKHLTTEWGSITSGKPGMTAKFAVHRKDAK